MREFGRAAGINDPGGGVRLKATVLTKEPSLLLWYYSTTRNSVKKY